LKSEKPRKRVKFSLNEARRIVLAAQGFTERRSVHPVTQGRLLKVIRGIGQLQIDSVNVLTRAHYVPLFSRLGPYPTKLLDQTSYSVKKRRLFEYWGHEACLIPIEHHPLFRWRMERAQNLEGIWGGVAAIARTRSDFVERVYECVKAHGPSGSSEVERIAEESKRARIEGWWGWSDCKRALEFLFWSGRITTAKRFNFERLYDLTERVIPHEILSLPTPSAPEAQRQLIRIAIGALGMGAESELRDYFRLSPADARHRIEELLDSGELIAATVAGKNVYLNPEAKIPRKIGARALISPFDPLVWDRKRLERVFEFRYRIGIYTPVDKREHGYYVLPFLLDDRLVARVDLKADRKQGVLQVLSAHGESRIDPKQVAEALVSELFLLGQWLGLDKLRITHSGDLASLLGALCADASIFHLEDSKTFSYSDPHDPSPHRS
jgi:uncharacterized protein YcaQ